MRALDSAFPGWTIAELKSAGIVAVGRYVAFKPNGKIIEKPEYDRYIANGIGVFLVWESSGTSFTGGYAAGYVEGHEARKQARALGHPDDCGIYWTIDTGAHFSASCSAYAHGFNDAGNVGVQNFYGDVEIGHALLDLGLITKFWQTNARGWPGDKVDSPHAVMIQRYALVVPGIRGSYDVDDVFAADFGQHPRPATVPAKPSKPVTPPVQHPSVNIGDDVHTKDISNVRLDKDGNGIEAFAGITNAQLIGAPAIFGGNDPAHDGHYDKVPVARYLAGANPVHVVIAGGQPFGVYTIRVAHA